MWPCGGIGACAHVGQGLAAGTPCDKDADPLSTAAACYDDLCGYLDCLVASTGAGPGPRAVVSSLQSLLQSSECLGLGECEVRDGKRLRDVVGALEARALDSSLLALRGAADTGAGLRAHAAVCAS